jgi:hypothetical protein
MTEKVRKFMEESEGVGRRMEPSAAGEHPVVVEAPPVSGGEPSSDPEGSDKKEGEE